MLQIFYFMILFYNYVAICKTNILYFKLLFILPSMLNYLIKFIFHTQFILYV